MKPSKHFHSCNHWSLSVECPDWEIIQEEWGSLIIVGWNWSECLESNEVSSHIVLDTSSSNEWESWLVWMKNSVSTNSLFKQGNHSLIVRSDESIRGVSKGIWLSSLYLPKDS